MRIPRGHAAVVYRNTLLLYGGEEDGTLSDKVLQFALTGIDDNARTIPCLGELQVEGVRPWGVKDHSCELLGTMMYVLGGVNTPQREPEDLNKLPVLNLATCAWERVTCSGDYPKAGSGYATSSRNAEIFLYTGEPTRFYVLNTTASIWRCIAVPACLPRVPSYEVSISAMHNALLLRCNGDVYSFQEGGWVMTGDVESVNPLLTCATVTGLLGIMTTTRCWWFEQDGTPGAVANLTGALPSSTIPLMTVVYKDTVVIISGEGFLYSLNPCNFEWIKYQWEGCEALASRKPKPIPLSHPTYVTQPVPLQPVSLPKMKLSPLPPTIAYPKEHPLKPKAGGGLLKSRGFAVNAVRVKPLATSSQRTSKAWPSSTRPNPFDRPESTAWPTGSLSPTKRVGVAFPKDALDSRSVSPPRPPRLSRPHHIAPTCSMEALTVPAPGTVEHDDFFDSFLFQTNTPPAPAGEPGNGEVTAATAEGLPPAKSMDMLEALLDTNEEDNYTSAFEGGKAYSSARYAAEEASHHAECAVCFEPLCNGQTVVFINTDRQRICRHYFHEPCVKDLRPDNSHLYRCPLCRNPFAIVLRMPDPRTDPKQWFRLASTREGDTLDLQEVQEVLLATVNTDSELLDAVVRNKWKEWDRNNTGIIEWTHADGLFEFVRMNLPGRREKPPPAIARDRGAWFEFFDTNAKGFLTEGAVSRGIIKSFPSHSSASQLAAMVREVFVLFATKGNLGSPLRDSSTSHLSISKEDFLKEEGLADVIISALSYEGIPVSSYQDEEDQAIAEQLQQTINEGSEVFSAEEWECPACTYINKSTAETCTMCQSSRPKRKSSDGGVGCGAEGVDDSRVEREEHPVVEIEPPAEVAGWTCTVCTLVNMEEATVCVVCTTPRHGRVRERERERDRERERHHRDEENERPTERRRRRSQMSSAVSSRPSTPPPRALSTPAALYPPESQWEPDSGRATCRACSATFTFFVRRHHCRGCGLLYCGECAPQRPSSRNPAHTERLCQSCTAIITE